MKSMIACSVVVLLLASVACGGFDYTISDTYEYDVTLDNESLLVMGGGAYSIRATGSSYVAVENTLPLQVGVGGIADLNIEDNSSLSYLGGETALFDIRDNGTAILKGGHINTIRSYQYVLGPNQTYIPHIEIVCKEHEYDSITKRLTGVWMDDTTFKIQLVNQSGYDPVIENIFFTPEPATLLLFALGGLALRRRG